MKLEGLNTLQAKLKRISKETETKVSDAIIRNADEIAAKANQDAPTMFKTKNSGFATGNEVRGRVNSVRLSKFQAEVSVDGVMAAYAEFGTGAYVNVPKGWEEVAWSYFKNGKGTIMPTPFFIPNVRKGKAQLIKDLKQIVQDVDKS